VRTSEGFNGDVFCNPRVSRKSTGDTDRPREDPDEEFVEPLGVVR
jgi:hypothetical protein